MKLSTVYSLFFILLLAVLSLSNRNGRASSQNWGNTGAPGDETLGNGQSRTCVTCHGTSSAIQVTLDIDIKDDTGTSIIDAGYEPGQTYDVQVRINPEVGSPAGYGFQMLALNAEEGVDADEVSTWTDLATNVKSAFAAFTGRTYVEHNGLSASNEFNMKWTAPMDLSGPVTFYAAGNGVNDNRANTGDGADTARLTIDQNLTSSLNALQPVVSWRMFPNPVRDQLQLEFETGGDVEYRIYNLKGLLVRKGNTGAVSRGAINSLDLSEMVAGTYLLQVINDRGQAVKKLVKQ